MAKGIFITGVDTDVGKTFVTAGINYILRKNNLKVCSYKAIESGGQLVSDKLISNDCKFVKEINNLDEEYEHMNVYCLKNPVSPHLASEIENIKINKDLIINKYQNLKKKYDYIVCEGSGGIIVPIIRNNYYIYDLIKDLDLSVILVSKANVGTINHTVLTVEFLKSRNIDIKGIIINNYEGHFYEDDNIRVIEEMTDINILAVLNKIKAKNDKEFIKLAKEEYEKNIDKSIYKYFS
ncbi:dethiobiotin synthase [Peptostreptococcaceae bacterium AGR-M142]